VGSRRVAERLGQAGRHAWPQRRIAVSAGSARHIGGPASRQRRLARRHHCQPTPRRVPKGALRIPVVDLGSLNGTYVNREPVESTVLANGDEIQIGKFRLVFFTRPTTD
jgi:hypothetical protein